MLDLKSPAERAELLEIARTCDVFLHNLRPQVIARLGLSYETVAAVNPSIIYVGVFGYGEDGPYAGKPAYDDLIQGASGIASLFAANRPDVEPRYIPLAIVDRIVGTHALGVILAAVHHQVRTGEGQQIEVPMFETMASMVLGDHLAGLTFDPPLDEGGYARLLAADRKPLRTSDGFICTLIYNDKQWKRFFELLGRDDAITDPRLRNQNTRTVHIEAIYAELAILFRTKSTSEWTALLEAADIPVMPLNDLNSLLDDPHIVATGMVEELDHPSEGRIRGLRIPSRWSATQPLPGRPAPRLGQHTGEVVQEARDLLAARAAGGPDAVSRQGPSGMSPLPTVDLTRVGV